jgi:hypothetical protein
MTAPFPPIALLEYAVAAHPKSSAKRSHELVRSLLEMVPVVEISEAIAIRGLNQVNDAWEKICFSQTTTVVRLPKRNHG